MLFHVGSLLRLHETGVLAKVDQISSVSGGSITSAVLAMAWEALAVSPEDPAPFFRHVMAPIRKMAGRSIDISSVLKGVLLPASAADRVANAYDKILFDGALISAVPERPRFVFCATNVQTASLVRFARDGIRNWRFGRVIAPDLRLSQAVAASSAFPPFLSPSRLSLDGLTIIPEPGADLDIPEFREQLVLTDGGVYDNLGLETVWKRRKTIFVSDAGGKIVPQAKPKLDWLLHLRRVLDLVDDQVRSLRKRQLLDAFGRNDRDGAYWGIRTDISAYGLADTLPCPLEATTRLADYPTRLAAVAPLDQERLINWGYAVCDAALRRHHDSDLSLPASFPYPASGIGA